MPTTQFIQPMQGRQVVGVTATPIAQITATSGTPSYTVKRVTDSAAWDLSSVEVGYIVEVTVSGEVWTGLVTAVDDANDYVEVQGWIKGGVSGQRRATMSPADGATAIIHKIDKCRRLLIDALDGNSDTVFLGFTSSVTLEAGADPGHPIPKTATQPNHRLVIEMGANIITGIDEYLDLKRTYVIGTAPDQVSWIAM